MRFPYRHLYYPPHIQRPPVPMPMLETRIRGPLGVYSLWLLVDSGAMETVVPTYALEMAGIRNPTGERMQLTGVGGAVQEADVYEGIEIEFGPRWSLGLKSRVLAHRDLDTRLAVLGHRDFFLRYFVGFDAGADVFTLSEPRRSRTN
jgi:hypothetical protein